MSKEIERGIIKRAAAFVSGITIALSSVASVGTAQERRVVRETSSSTSNTDAVKGKQPSHSDTESNWTDGRDTVRVKARNLELTDDGQAVKSLSDGGYLTISEYRGGASRELRVSQSAGGSFEYKYVFNGKPTAFDAGAQSWLSGILLEFVRSSGFATERRVSWLLSRGGAAAVLSEVSLLPSDNIKRAYLQRLVEQGNLDSPNLVRILEMARQQITSDYELTEFLVAAQPHVNMSGEVRAALQKTLQRLHSDNDRGRVLTAFAKMEN
ncbi:MAG TPA: hypothetical protein VM934_07790 [Pyrinomonadaceae bacterium]|jgi:hypothetical protein|nr:hypothetical protein [Pyrinomonadaceae bacterium]